MNEGLAVFLHLDEEKTDENEALIRKIDELLLTEGMKYSGFRNLYVPVDREERDSAVYKACRTLRETEWLKGILAHTLVSTRINACSMGEILTDRMTDPSPEKLQYYEAYCQTTGKLAHGIVVDQNRQLRDGYTSYLLAKKYGIHPEIYEAFEEQPLRKIVTGRHVNFVNGSWKVRSQKRYAWKYTLKKPVVPGDILQVVTKKGLNFICVDRIDYATGQNQCAEYKRVKKHMNMRLEE